ncbi:MAG TPA: hypothetical protein VFW50_24530 [Streptosporangiaceae bacterium]|nr:hypothetical protein [Streptosporangiaceae bacterium]
MIDPELVSEERRRMAAEDQRRREAAVRSRQRATTASRWTLGSLAAFCVSALLYFVTGLTGGIAVACAIASTASLAAYALATRPRRSAAMVTLGPAPGPHQAVLLTELDEPSRELLTREQRAIDGVISSGLYDGREEARQAVEAQLRRIEWQAAARPPPPAGSPNTPGPRTAMRCLMSSRLSSMPSPAVPSAAVPASASSTPAVAGGTRPARQARAQRSRSRAGPGSSAGSAAR